MKYKIIKKQLSIIFVILVLISLYSIHQASNIDSYESQNNDHHLISSATQHNQVFLWDLHEVVFEKKMWDWILIGWNHKHKFETITKLNTQIIAIMFTYLLEKLRLTSTQATSEELIAAAKKAGNHALVDLAVKIGCSYYPIAGTIAIINELKLMGYTHHIGSNIGATTFVAFKPKFPEIFNQFDAEHIVHYVEGKPVIKKPHARFFTTYLEKYNLKPEQVIFIDDKSQNVNAARSLGITAIHFKNPDQLRSVFQKLGFPLASNTMTEKTIKT